MGRGALSSRASNSRPTSPVAPIIAICMAALWQVVAFVSRLDFFRFFWHDAALTGTDVL